MLLKTNNKITTTLAILAFGVIISTANSTSATEPKHNSQQLKIEAKNTGNSSISTSAADLGEPIQASFDIYNYLIESKDSGVGGDEFNLQLPEEPFILEQNLQNQTPNRYLRLWKITF